VPNIISISPFKCRVWRFHERLEGEITEESCREEIASFASEGQIVPVLGRRLHGDAEHEIELIFGARRLFVARHLGKPIQVEVRDLTDREAIIAMDVENRLRKEVSPYERGLSYVSWLRSGLFESQGDIARALNVSASQVSRLLRIAKLPAVVVDAFRSSAEICETWGLDLMDALDDPQRREATIRSARRLAQMTPRPVARDAFRRLTTYADRGDRPSAGSHDKVVLGSDGVPLFRIRYQNDSIALIVPLDKVSRQSLQRIEADLASILQPAPTLLRSAPEEAAVAPILALDPVQECKPSRVAHTAATKTRGAERASVSTG
jgi:ParB family chromosome partitioning protein